MNEKGYRTIKFSDFEAFGQRTKISNVDLLDFDFVSYVLKRFVENMSEQISVCIHQVTRKLLNIDTFQMSDDELCSHLDFANFGGFVIVYWDKEYLFRLDFDYSYYGDILTVKCRVSDYRSLEHEEKEENK